MRDIFNMKF